MTAPYKKRAKAGWNTDKTQSNRDERNYEPVDVAEQVAETSKLRKVTDKKKPSKLEREVKKALDDVKWALRWTTDGDIESLRNPPEAMNQWSRNYRQELYQAAKKSLPKLHEYLKMELPNKLRKHILEVLEKVK
jgi:hypothetical protein